MTIQAGAPFFPSGDLKTRLHFGRPASTKLREHVTGPWTLVVTAGSLRRCHEMGVFDDLPRPKETIVIAPGLLTSHSLRQAWRPGPARVVGIGAGSTLDAAKLVRQANVLGRFPNRREDWNADRHVSDAPLICVPTTAGSGSELTPTASLWDDGVKSSIEGQALQPSDAVYDPPLLMSAGPEIRTAALWDAMSHALEALWSRDATMASDRYARFALETMTRALEKNGVASDRSQSDLSLGSAAAGAAMSKTRSGIAHALSYSLTGRHGLRHGLAAGLFALATLELLPNVDWERADMIARIAGSLDVLWRTTGAAELVAVRVTPEMILEADETLNPDRANRSVVPPDPAIVAEIRRRAAALR
jgi:alcohol dehydrogenase class IV